VLTLQTSTIRKTERQKSYRMATGIGTGVPNPYYDDVCSRYHELQDEITTFAGIQSVGWQQLVKELSTFIQHHHNSAYWQMKVLFMLSLRSLNAFLTHGWRVGGNGPSSKAIGFTIISRDTSKEGI
jgi:hypothetical protein